MANYGSLVSGNLTFAGVDQGIDFTGKGSVLALGDGIVTRAIPHGSGWPGEGAILVYRITKGPAKGKYVYIAEDFAVATGLRTGSHIKAGQIIGTATGSGQAPGIEIGWANENGRPIASLGKNKRAATSAGKDFLNFVTSAAPNAPAPASTGPAEGAAVLPDYTGGAQVGPQSAGPPAQLDPGTVQAGGFTPRAYGKIWQQVANQPLASADTAWYAKQASGGA